MHAGMPMWRSEGSDWSRVVGVGVNRYVLALLAGCSTCRCTTAEYELDGGVWATIHFLLSFSAPCLCRKSKA